MQKDYRQLVVFALLCIAGATSAWGQSAWVRSYGGASFEQGSSVAITPDGGLVVAGSTNSYGAGDYDIWILKLDSNGAVQWQKSYGGSGEEWPWSVITTSDGGYAVCGHTYSFGSGDADWWILKLGASGNTEWQKAYGGSAFDYARSIQQTTDGGFIVAGSTASYGAGGQDAWILKLSASGNIQWQKTYGKTFDDVANSIEQTADGGYIAAGRTGVTASTYNAWVFKLDASGNVLWERAYGTVADQIAQAIHQTIDGGYVVAVEDVDAATNTYDFVVLKLDSSGNITWQKRYSGAGNDDPWTIQQTQDGGYVVAGRTTSFGAGSFDAWVLKLDASGVIQWQKTYGGPGFDDALFVKQTPDGGYVLAGSTDVDLWVLKLTDAGEVNPACTLGSDSFGSTSVSTYFAVGNSSTVNSTVTSIAVTTASPITTTGSMQEMCGPVCVFCDDFEDGVLASDWTYLKPAWSESGGNLIATSTRQAVAVASPAFAGCGSNCSFEGSMMSSGGVGNKVWMLAWYLDKRNMVQILMKEQNDKFVVKQRAGGSVVAKTKGLATVLPNVSYNVKITFDGTTFTLFVDGNLLATLPAAAPATGTIGFQAKNTTAKFGHVLVQ